MTLLPWTAPIAERVRILALLRCSQGWSSRGVAEFLGIHPRTVRRWKTRLRREGEAGLSNRPRSGRPPKLSATQTEQVLGWIEQTPKDFGFTTERWTAPRLAAVIEEVFGVALNHRYLNDWLRRHGVSPQIPERRPRERDPLLVQAWVRHQWPRIKKKPGSCTHP
jgi:transposase